MHYDKERKTLCFSGAELVDFARRRTTPTYRDETEEEESAEGRAVWRRQLIGQRDGIPLTGEFTREGQTFSVTMTVDDLTGGCVTLIYPMAGNPKSPDPETMRRARGMGFLAAYLAERNCGGSFSLKIYFVSSLTPFPEVYEEEPQHGAPARFFERLCDRAVVHAAPLIDRQVRRLPTLVSCRFPYPAVREGQRELMETVYTALAHGRRLYACAPTGIGKTVSVLYPAIRALGEGKVEKVFYLTPKNTASLAAAETLNALQKAGAEVRGVCLSAKDSICPEGRVCRKREPCRLSPSAPTREDQATRFLLEQNAAVVTREMLLDAGRQFRVCPYELGLRYSLYCDVIICDYNYLFDPRVALKRYFTEGGNYAFLIDEAHNLAERVRENYATHLSLAYLARLEKLTVGAEHLSREVKRFADSYREMMTRLLRGEVREEKAGEKTAFLALHELPDGYLTEVFGLAYALFDALPRLPDEKRLALTTEAYQLKNMAEKLAHYDERFIAFLRYRAGDFYLDTLCLDPAAVIDERLSLGRSAVLFSATLSPLPYYREILGGRRNDLSLEVSSPFDEKHLAVCVMDKISTRYLEREDTVREVVRAILTTVKAKPGNYMVFCPSYHYLIRLHEALHKAVPALETLCQSQNMSQAERERFLARFDAASKTALVGFCVMGGIYSEGIDLVGKRLIGAVVVGVGLPQLSDEREAIRAYFDEKNEEGRGFAYVYPGMNRVLQAAGRVIRTESDRGVVLLIDDRFASPEYRHLIPPHWHGLRYVGSSRDLSHLLDEFWHGEGKNR